MKPRLGFLGTGWIGRHRMAAMVATGGVDAVAVCDPSPECIAEAATIAPTIHIVDSLDAMLALDIDGVVIATPSALHADQSIQAFQAGKAVFCQKPLGRTAAEVDAVIAAARAADRLLGVDLSYRHTAGMEAIAGLIREGTLGDVFAIDLTFHNAYGPDKPWFYDPAQSGGGCVVDLGVHLVDLALWALGFPKATEAQAALYAGGQPLHPGSVEDYASASFKAGGTNVRLTCSWRLHAGPLMRRYLDGYLPMQARLAFQWPEGLLRLQRTTPAGQPGVTVHSNHSGAQLDLVFAGRMTATLDLVRGTP